MEQEATISELPSHVLREVASSMNWRDRDIKVTLPIISTWKMALRATLEALGERDGPVMVTHPRPEHVRQALRQSALDNVNNDWPWAESADIKISPGQPIRTTYDIATLPTPERASENVRKLLKENELSSSISDRDPYLFTLKPSITEKTLPLVKANISLSGLDSSPGDPTEKLWMADMIWDTGAHQTTIAEELLSEPFRQYLKDPQHDKYRGKDGLRVQMDAMIGFSNSPIKLTANVWVVPKKYMPNQLNGILFGQMNCINQLSYRIIPRLILEADGVDVDEGIWGDLVLDRYIDLEGNLVSL